MDNNKETNRSTNGELVHISVLLDKFMKELQEKREQNLKENNKGDKKHGF